MRSIKFIFSLFLIVKLSTLSAQSGYTVAPFGDNGIIIRPTAQTVNQPFQAIVSGFNWLRDYSNDVARGRLIESLLSRYANAPANKTADYWRIDFYSEPSGAKLMGEISFFGKGENLNDAFMHNYKTPGIRTTPPSLPFAEALFIRFEKTNDGVIIQENSMNDTMIRSAFANAKRQARSDIQDWATQSSQDIPTINDIYPEYLGKAIKRNRDVNILSRQIVDQQQKNQLSQLNRKYEALEYEMKKSLESYMKNQKELARQNRLLGIGNLLLSIASAGNSIYQSGEISDLEKSINNLTEQNNDLSVQVNYLTNSISNMHKKIIQINQQTTTIINNNNLNINIVYPAEPPVKPFLP